jgi:hypothetical protein
MSNHQKLLAAINEHVEVEIQAGRPVDVTAAAISLSSQYPQSGIAIDEIVKIIENTTINADGALYNGSRPVSEAD